MGIDDDIGQPAQMEMNYFSSNLFIDIVLLLIVKKGYKLTFLSTYRNKLIQY